MHLTICIPLESCTFIFLSVMSSDWIMLIQNLSLSQPPSDKGRKFFMSTTSSTSTSPAPSMASLNNNTTNISLKVSSSKSTFQKIKSLADDLRGKYVFKEFKLFFLLIMSESYSSVLVTFNNCMMSTIIIFHMPYEIRIT